MTDIEIADTVKRFVMDRYLIGEDPARLTPTTPLLSGGILDSMSVLELVSFLEDRFRVEFQPHELDRDHFDSLDAISRLVEEKLQRRP